MIRREATELRRIIRDVIAASLVVPGALVACDEKLAAVPMDASAAIDAGADATIGDAALEAAADADADLGEAAPDPCGPEPYDAGPDGDATAATLDICANLVRLPCGLPHDVVPRDGCFLTLNDCGRFCKGAYFNCHAWDDSCVDGSIPDGGPVTIDCVICLGGPGRRPRGLVDDEASLARAATAPNVSHAGRLLAAMARLEAASIDAFCMLRRDLARLGAPRELVRAAAAAARDETRHARVVGRLAQRRGVTAPKPTMRPTSRPTLEALAVENAVEGCVHETFGALLAAWQATHARDLDVARAMERIAADELRHAALSWAIARWAEPRLDDAARARVRASARRAADRLVEHGAVTPPPTVHERVALGVPSRREQQALARTLLAELERAMAREAEAA